MAFTKHELILPKSIVEDHGLPSDVVTIKHLHQLLDLQEARCLKLAPKLTRKSLDPSHFNKMNVGEAMHVLSREVASALEYMVDQGSDKELLTTAWWIKSVRRWYDLLNSRKPALAFSFRYPEKYEEAISHIKMMIDVFKNMRVGLKGRWKPIQTGVIMVSKAMLDMVHKLLSEKDFQFVMTSRFSQDALENTFSLVRLKKPLPLPKQVKYALRSISISQFMKEQKNSNYDFDDGHHLADFLIKPEEKESEDDTILPTFMSDINTTNSVQISSEEEAVLYYIAGNP